MINHLLVLHPLATATTTHGTVTMWQAVILGVIQGISELFPISSLGHTVILPSIFGWHSLVTAESQSESFWLAFVVMLHVGSAVGLLIYFWRDWIRIIGAWFHSVITRSVTTSSERLAWLIVFASIPAGVIGLAFEHPIRVALTKPASASGFLILNGFILLGAERLRRRGAKKQPVRDNGDGILDLSEISYANAGVIGVAQSAALIAGISRDGICMAAGLARGLDHEDSAKFAFLLATPIIFAAGIYKLPDLTGPLGAGVRSQALVAALCAAVTAVFSVAFLMRYFKTKNLQPFGIYCLLFGLGTLISSVA